MREVREVDSALTPGTAVAKMPPMPRLALAALIGLGAVACACGGRFRGSPDPEPDMQPTLDHAALMDALERGGDASLLALFASEDDYYVEPVPFASLTATRIFRAVPANTSEPVDFLVAVALDTGRATLTSQRAAGVASVLFAEPRPFELPDLPRLAFELVRPRAVALRFVASAEDLPEAQRAAFSPPAAQRSGEGMRLAFEVLDEGRVIEWELELEPPARGRLVTRTILPGETR